MFVKRRYREIPEKEIPELQKVKYSEKEKKWIWEKYNTVIDPEHPNMKRLKIVLGMREFNYDQLITEIKMNNKTNLLQTNLTLSHKDSLELAKSLEFQVFQDSTNKEKYTSGVKSLLDEIQKCTSTKSVFPKLLNFQTQIKNCTCVETVTSTSKKKNCTLAKHGRESAKRIRKMMDSILMWESGEELGSGSCILQKRKKKKKVKQTKKATTRLSNSESEKVEIQNATVKNQKINAEGLKYVKDINKYISEYFDRMKDKVDAVEMRPEELKKIKLKIRSYLILKVKFPGKQEMQRIVEMSVKKYVLKRNG